MPRAEPASALFGELLRRRRAEAGLSQEELADAARIGVRTVSDLERGVARTARKETARLLADALGLAGDDRYRFESVARGRGANDASFAGAIKFPGAISAPKVLPRDIESFSGRSDELAQLLQPAARAGPPVSGSADVVGIRTIGGMAGIGKTALAVHAAHRLAPRFPDGHIFLCLHGHTPGRRPVDPAEALASLLQTCGIGAADIPADVETRTAVWRNRVAGKRMLLVLDDAATSDQVRPLLPGTSGSLVLITSRRYLTALEDARSISLEVLPEADAIAMLVRLADRPGMDPTEPALARIASFCGRLPLAVGIMGRQLHHHPGWAPAELASDLSATRDRLALLHAENLSVAVAFDLSYAELTPDEQRLFRLLGLHPGPDIEAHAAAALTDTDHIRARRWLEGLYDHHMIGQSAHGRYRFHDLIREHAQALAAGSPRSDREAATRRLLDHYQYTAALAGCRAAEKSALPDRDLSVLPPGPLSMRDRRSALTWLRAERNNVLACLDHARSTGQHSRVVALTAGLARILEFDGPWGEGMTRHSAAVRAARQCGDRLGEALALCNLADLQTATGGVGDAEKALGEALSIYRDVRDRRGVADTLYLLGWLLWHTADFEASRAALEEALAIHRDLGDLMGEASDLRQLAVASFETDDYRGATAAVEEALAIHRELGDRHGEAWALYLLGAVRQRMGEHLDAIEPLEEARVIFGELGHRVGMAATFGSLGDVLVETGDLNGAAAAAEQALDICAAFGDARSQAFGWRLTGIVRREMGDVSGAADALLEALHIFGDIDDAQGRAETLNALGVLHLNRGEVEESLECHQTARELALQTRSSWIEAHALAGIGRCELAAGNTVGAAERLGQAFEIFQSIGVVEAARLAAEMSDLPGLPSR